MSRQEQDKLVKKKTLIEKYISINQILITSNQEHNDKLVKELKRINKRLKALSDQEFEVR